MRFDFLVTPATAPKGRQMIEAMFLGAVRLGLDGAMVVRGVPRKDAVLVLYGMGGSDRLPLAQAHQRQGGRVIAFDAGYWDRKGANRRFRVSLDGLHCPARIMAGRNPGPARFESSQLAVGRSGNSAGPILLIGNGPKSNAIGAQGWTARKSVELRKAFPGKRLLYRPKPKKPAERNVIFDGLSANPIDDALKGISLVVCRHSNVAVDATRLGVPVVCEDGAAASIYPSMLARFREQPSATTRLEFLHRLAWWQWSHSESDTFWPWMLEQLA